MRRVAPGGNSAPLVRVYAIKGRGAECRVSTEDGSVRRADGMHKRRMLAFIALWACALLAAGCGLTSMGNASASNPPTITSGPVTIATDHTTYGPNDTIHVTVVNHLSTAIAAFDTRASCSILALQVQRNGNWQQAEAAPCPLGRVARLVTIPAGGSYTADITAGFPGMRAGSFANGQYRLVLAYYPSGPSGTPSPASASATTITSATLSVAGGSGSSSPRPLATGTVGA